MSLINDALRRTNQGKKNSTGESRMENMKAVEPAQSRFGFAPLILLALAVVALMFSGWFFWRALVEKGSVKISKAIEVSVPSPVLASPELPVQSVIAKAPELPTPEPVAASSSNLTTTAEIATNSAPTTNAVEIPAPPAPPSLKLQGILFRTTNPSALINGKTLLVGEIISGARVMSITREGVTLDRDGTTISLTLR